MAEILLQLGILLAWIGFSYFEGYREAFSFHMRDHRKDQPEDPHRIFNFTRFFVYSTAILGLISLGLSYGQVIIYGVALLAMFPFLHDGKMYAKRNFYDPSLYPKRWQSDAPRDEYENKSDLSFDYKPRLVLAFCSLGLIITQFIAFYAL